MTTYLYLAIEFFKTGLFAIGGGLATLPFLYEIAEKYDWLDISLMSDMIAVSESTPGPIGVNMATYAGYNAGLETFDSPLYGVLGGMIATLSLVLPSVVIIIIVANFLNRFQESRLVKDSFEGLKPAVCGLIAAAAVTVFAEACLNIDLYNESKRIADMFNIEALVMFAVFFLITNKIKLHPIFYIIPAAVLGIVLKM